ncbi:nucleotide exchange factor GrpE [Brevibacillus humidisoli]|uniref:nucleotide exchange factor GrpE n=1 Tax=Brevibacillus humidisoli TaxID=2895522 RepID=UPI001E36824F|nr:nucleotide exchange factor GrpE [Brevibacillus humidisoli]UFJ43174.1 nucleotide exchange factor GrpE [Brevibacillus humidisoli]
MSEEKPVVEERDENKEAEAAAEEQSAGEQRVAGEQAGSERGEGASGQEPDQATDYKALAEEYESRMLRALADMENMRRRFRKEQEDLAKYASQKVIEAMLPALDNFERALEADTETLTVDSLLQGVQMVYRQIQQVFEQEGLAPIEAQGKPFDPNVHQAVMQVEDSSLESGVVVEELQKGYQFKDRVLRPAMVKVNR